MKGESTPPTSVSRPTFFLLDRAKKVWRRSDGPNPLIQPIWQGPIEDLSDFSARPRLRARRHFSKIKDKRQAWEGRLSSDRGYVLGWRPNQRSRPSSVPREHVAFVEHIFDPIAERQAEYRAEIFGLDRMADMPETQLETPKE
jgi:hypothetical protein